MSQVHVERIIAPNEFCASTEPLIVYLPPPPDSAPSVNLALDGALSRSLTQSSQMLRASNAVGSHLLPPPEVV